jgi:hypothetical protein
VKKAIVILLMVLYSASTIGATINMHYCMNKFAGYSFNQVKKDKCPKCGMKNTGCCKDEKKQIKLLLDQQKTGENSINHSVGLIPVTSADYYFNLGLQKFTIDIFSKQHVTCLHAPPILLKQHTQAALSQFII